MAKRVQLRLNELLEKRGMTQAQLAEQIGIRQPTLSEMKRRSTINISLIEKIADALNLEDIRELITLVDDSE